MPRCPNGSRKNKKTGKCVSNKSGRSPASKKASRSPASRKASRSPASRKASRSPRSATKKVKRVAKAKIYLGEEAINNIIDQNEETIKYKKVSIPEMKEVLRKVYYKPRFESEYYFGRLAKKQLKKNKYPTGAIERALLAQQMYALIREWGKSYISLEDFTSKRSFYSHSME
jgi:hypothetical protein